MTEVTKKTIRGSLLLLLATAAIGYGLISWAFPTESLAQPTMSAQFETKGIHDAELLQAFYQEQGMRTIWLRGQTKFQPRAEAVLNILKNSWTQGLNPENYHVAKLEEIAANPSASRHEFDVLMTDAVIHYVRDLTGMRGKHNPNDRADKYWRQPMEAKDILQQVALAGDPVHKIKDLEPNSKLYVAMREELIRLSKAEKDSAAIKISGALKPKQTHDAVALIRTKLGLPASESKVYDDALAAEVIKFQRVNGLKADGIVRADTISALNRTNESKMTQIIANMERIRWMEQGRPDRYILVNIPSASLWAVENGEVAMEMPVIVGKTARPTYSFKTEITGVRLNPNWTVPPTIKKVDFLPMLQNDPNALAKRGIKMVHNGKTIDPASIDWGNVGNRGLSNISMVQNPGDDNPLGKVRVIMENPYNIYLHDTNHRELFDKDERLLSSGCIRVSQPEKLADFILKNNEGWSWNGMQEMIDSGRMRDIKTESKLPVYITYQTIWLDSEGKLIYGRDVYGQDEKLSKILQNAGGIHIPQNTQNAEISL